jgi:hypothetical protein
MLRSGTVIVTSSTATRLPKRRVSPSVSMADGMQVLPGNLSLG